MAYHVEGQSYLALFFNGEEFPFNKVNTFERLHISEGVKLMGLPLLNLVLVDGQKWMLRNGFVADNARLRVVFGPGSNDPKNQRALEFRIVSISDSTLVTGSSRYVIDAFLDAPRYMSSSLTDSIKGTSADALKKIADHCGLTFEGIGTSDHQNWRPSNLKIYKFARHIVERGYASENSCMMAGVDTNKRLVYRDISAMEGPTGTFGLKDLTGTTGIPTTSFLPNLSSGVLNQMTGLSSAVVEQVIGAENVNKIHKGIGTVINDVGSLLQNAVLKAAVGIGAVRYSPVDTGVNNHPNSERARYQNERGAHLFSSTLSLTCPVITNVHLLDTASVSTANIEPADPSAIAYSGKYRVFHKVMYLEPGSYTEKFVLARRTLNIKLPESVTSSGDPGGSGSSAKPAKTVDIPAPIRSLASFLGFDPTKATETFNKVMDTLNDQNVQQGLALAAAVTLAVTKMNSVPTVRPPLDALLQKIRDLEAEGIAAINTQKQSVPYGDPENTLPPIVTDYAGRIDAAIGAAAPEIQNLAQRTLRVTASTKDIASGQNAASVSATKFNSVASSVSSSLKVFGTTGSFQADSTAAAANYVTAANNTVTAVNSEVASATAAANVLEVDATTYPQIISAQKTTSVAALNAAIVYT